jgi:subtilisin family serine protease
MALGQNPPPNYSEPAVGCNDATSFKVAVLDGGLDVTHKDFSYCGLGANGQAISGRLTRCIGDKFFEADATMQDQQWYNSRNGHGTHVS